MKKTQRILMNFFAVMIVLSTATGCYRMPDEEECSLIPTTNNPTITGDSGNHLIPNGAF